MLCEIKLYAENTKKLDMTDLLLKLCVIKLCVKELCARELNMKKLWMKELYIRKNRGNNYVQNVG